MSNSSASLINYQTGPNSYTSVQAELAALAILANYGPIGQCQFNYVSATQCVLSRFNGQYLMINGVAQSIPSAGVTLANTGLVASTIYYVYAFMNAGVMTLEASTTVNAADPVSGVQIKGTDSTRTLVGCLYSGGGSPASFQTQGLTLSYFNRRVLSIIANGVLTQPPSSVLSFVGGSGVTMMRWPDEAVEQYMAGTALHSAVSGAGSISIGFSVRGLTGTIVNDDIVNQGTTSSGSGYSYGFSGSFKWTGTSIVSSYYISVDTNPAASIDAGSYNNILTRG
jgi:hypothetical protein